MNENPFDNAIQQLKKASSYLLRDKKSFPGLDEILVILAVPNRIVDVSLPVEMDNGTIKVFHGYRVQHNNLLGPFKGGIRFHPQVNLDEVKALSFWMTMKSALVGNPLGGGKGGIEVDPKLLSAGELERLSRAYVRSLIDILGPYQDVPAPDVNTNPLIMGWMIDEYLHLKKSKKTSLKATFTGKKIEDGGSEGREAATGQGGLYVLQKVLAEMGINNRKKPLTAVVQGFGNVGYFTTSLLTEAGIRVVGVSDSKGGIYVPEGINPQLTLACKKANGSSQGGLIGCYCSGTVCDMSKGRPISNAELLTLPVDIVVPSALEQVITRENASKIQAKIILEMANGPTTPEADVILQTKGVEVIPDILANAGGVTVSRFEWEQNLKGVHWTAGMVQKKLKKHMENATTTVWATKKLYQCDMRTAAFITALKTLWQQYSAHK